jgi:exopolyphosphatase/guanosine-5'-triphosphate,3'-diphosphate pyrophosphatase
VIAIDLGSNTIRFLAFDENGRQLWESQFVVRTAEGLISQKVISSSALERIAQAIDTAKKAYDFSGETITAVATEAFRQAQNSAEAIAYLRKRSQIDFRVISSHDEATLTAKACVRSARKHGLIGALMMIDIGGASSEAVLDDGAIKALISLPIGIVTATEAKTKQADMEAYLRNALNALDPFMAQCAAFDRPNALIATAGTPTTLAAIKRGLDYARYDKQTVNGTSLSVDEIRALYARLASLNAGDLEILVGRTRGDLVLTGALILQALMTKLGFDSCVVFDEGLREGVMYDMLEKISDARV